LPFSCRNINIGSNGLDAKAVDILDILAKGVRINGIINAKNMLIQLHSK
jgi:hypothetical protein